MLSIEDIKEDQEIMDCLNLEMTPEKAVAVYLEWGAFTAHGKDFARSANDASCYFTLDTWKSPARVVLVKQSTAEDEILGEVALPPDLLAREVAYWGGRKGTYGISEELRDWISKELDLHTMI
jgi:hypothetical protein